MVKYFIFTVFLSLLGILNAPSALADLQMNACIAADGKYACSQYTDCRDVAACSPGRTPLSACSPLPGNNVDLCGTLASRTGTSIRGGLDQTIGWGITNPFAGSPDNVLDAVLVIINWLANIAGSLLVIMIIYGGVRFVVSKGNSGEITKAKTILWWALVGMAVVLIGKGFVFIIDNFLRGRIT